jgi:predicted secreted protein
MTSLRRILAIALIGALASLALLVAPAGAASVPAYHQKDSGKTVHVVKGHEITVDLRAATGTPCSYKVTQGKHSATFKIVSRTTHDAPHPAGIVGFPYDTVWTLKGTKAGTDTFKVALVCEGAVAKRFKLTLRVTRR